MNSIRVVVVDDQHLVRSGFRMILESEPGIDVVGEAADGREAIEVTERSRPDVVLMDIRMPGLDGIAATEAITARADAPRVLVLTTFDADEYVFGALRAGASGFVLKDLPPEQLIDAVRTIAAGDAVVAPSVTTKLVAALAQTTPMPPPPALEQLTEREREVLILVARGLSNLEVAERLIVGEATVKTHLGRVLAKLQLRDRVQAVVFAYEHGLVAPGSP
jgi:DNA-binding NarL/FixJ family response regulator